MRKTKNGIGILVIFGVLTLGFSAEAATLVPCTNAAAAGDYFGVSAGTDQGTPFSTAFVVRLNAFGQLTAPSTIFFSEPGAGGQNEDITGTYSLISSTLCLMTITLADGSVIFGGFVDGTTFYFSSAFSSTEQSAGIARRL